MLFVTEGAPERAALTRAGFTIAPGVNQHVGQGSASVTVELANGFLELAWRDPGVFVAPGREFVAERFERMSAWRTSGWAPVGIGLRRAASAPEPLPFATRKVGGPWMPAGDSLEIVSATDDTLGPRLWVVPRSMAATGRPDSESELDRLSKEPTLVHANGARTITAVKVTMPGAASSAATRTVAAHSHVVFARGPAWLVEVTFDGGRRHQTRDLRPDLPLVCHF